MCSVFGELPALGLEVLGNERPVEGRRPVGDVAVVLVDPGLIVVLVGGELDGGEVVDVVM